MGGHSCQAKGQFIFAFDWVERLLFPPKEDKPQIFFPSAQDRVRGPLNKEESYMPYLR
jgi:hypothetical protein